MLWEDKAAFKRVSTSRKRLSKDHEPQYSILTKVDEDIRPETHMKYWKKHQP